MRCAEQTLAKYATQGCGPEFHRYGRDVVYAVEKLDEWALSRLSKPVRSTSQTDTPACAAATQSVSDAGDRSAVLTKGDFRHPEASATPVEEPSRSGTPSPPAPCRAGPPKTNQTSQRHKGRDSRCRNPQPGKMRPRIASFFHRSGPSGTRQGARMRRLGAQTGAMRGDLIAPHDPNP